MNKAEAQEFFEKQYYDCPRPGVAGLQCGANYMFDAEGKLWLAEVWAIGPIWFIKEIEKGPHYESAYIAACYDESTFYQAKPDYSLKLPVLKFEEYNSEKKHDYIGK